MEQEGSDTLVKKANKAVETQANYTLVGAFILLFLAAIVVFIIWIARIDVGETHKYYKLEFMESVTGLNVGSTVRYRGVPAGTVQKITLDPETIDKISVLIKINEDIPIKEDAHASLEIQGITGIRYILIEGGTQASPLRIAEPDQRYPIIPVKISALEQVSESLPRTLSRISSIVEKLDKAFTDSSQQNLEQTLGNLNIITASIARSDKDGENVVDEARHVAINMQKALKSIERLVVDLRQNGVPALNKFMTEASEMFGNITNSLEAINRSPRRFLANDPRQGHRVK